MRLVPSIPILLATLLISLSAPAAPPAAVPDPATAAAVKPDRAPSPSPRASLTGGAAPMVPYRSAFESYRKFEADAPPEDWITVNTRVQQRGGWREYAREAARANAAPAGDRK